MKKLIPCIMTAFLLLLFNPTPVEAVTHSKTAAIAARNVESANTHALLARLDEIRAMDFSSLSSPERKSLRKELRSLKSQFAAIGGGVYFSAGAIILILILLLIFVF